MTVSWAAKKAAAVLPGAFDTSVKNLFEKAGWRIETSPLRYGCDLLVLTGGEDINPALYGEPAIEGTSFSTRRDTFEAKLVDYFKDLPKIGICRGAQLLNVLCGGKMWQDTDHHNSGHGIRLVKSGETFHGSSIHHQMMIPGEKAEILAVADDSTYVQSAKETRWKVDEPFEDIEALWYSGDKAFCWQGHPEISTNDEKAYFFDLVQQTLGI